MPLPKALPCRGLLGPLKTGYKGRLALHEVMAVSEPIERLAVEHASATRDFGRQPKERGDADAPRRRHVQGGCNGVTTIDEILRVVDSPPGLPSRPPTG